MLFSSVTHIIIIIIIVVVVVVVVVMGGRSALSSASSSRDRDFSIHFMLMTVLYAILNMTPSPHHHRPVSCKLCYSGSIQGIHSFRFLANSRGHCWVVLHLPREEGAPHQCHLSHFTQGDTHTHTRYLSPSPPLSLSLSRLHVLLIAIQVYADKCTHFRYDALH